MNILGPFSPPDRCFESIEATVCVYIKTIILSILTYVHVSPLSPNLIAPISLGTLFPLVLQQGISAFSAVGPHPSIKDAPEFQTSSEFFGRLGITPLLTRCYDATVRGCSSLVKNINLQSLHPKPSGDISMIDPPQQWPS